MSNLGMDKESEGRSDRVGRITLVLAVALPLAAALPLLAMLGASGCDEEKSDLCGNNRVDRGETCDASAVGGRTCQDQGFSGGTLSCNATCDDFDTSGCWMQMCGNGIEEADELCDGDDLGGNSCVTLGKGYDGGTLLCNENCDGFDESGCTLPDTGGVEGRLTLSVNVTCDATDTLIDCAGNAYVAVVENDPMVNPNQVPLGQTMVESVDLSGDGSALFAIGNIPAGTWYITGFLDDDDSVTPQGRAPNTGDPVIMPMEVTITEDATTTQDLTFSLRMP